MNRVETIKNRVFDNENLSDLLKRKNLHFKAIPNKKIKLAIAQEGKYCLGIFVYDSKEEIKNCLRICYKDTPEMMRQEGKLYKNLGAVLEKMKQKFHIDFFVGFSYEDKMLKFSDEETLPGLLMEWAGDTLSSVLYPGDEDAKPSQKFYKRMADSFMDVCHKMKEIGIVHGDLSSNNIMVSNDGKIKLIDYDSLYIPSENFIGSKAYECTGTSGFCHPGRNEKSLSLYDDNFSQLIVYITLLTYSYYPELNDITEVSDVLMFSGDEIASLDNFRNSGGYNKIKEKNNPELLFYLNELEKAFDVPYDQVPFLCDLHYEPKEKPMPLITETKNMIMAGFCGRCGHHFNNQTDLFCPDCGTKRVTL